MYSIPPQRTNNDDVTQRVQVLISVIQTRLRIGRMTKIAAQHQVHAVRNKEAVKRMISVEVEIWFVRLAQLVVHQTLMGKNVATLKVIDTRCCTIN